MAQGFVTGLSACRYDDLFRSFDSRTNDHIQGDFDPATKALLTASLEYGFEGLLAQLAEFKRDVLTLMKMSNKNEGILHAVSSYFDGLSSAQKRLHIEFSQTVGNLAPSPQYFTFDKYFKDKSQASDSDNFMDSNFNSRTSNLQNGDSPQPFDDMPPPKDSPTRQRMTFGPEDRGLIGTEDKGLVLKPVREEKDDFPETPKRILDVQFLLDLVRPNRSREGSRAVPEIQAVHGVRDSQDMTGEIRSDRMSLQSDDMADQHDPYTKSPPASFQKPQKSYLAPDLPQQTSQRATDSESTHYDSQRIDLEALKQYRFGSRDEVVPGASLLAGWSTSITAVARNPSMYSFEFVDTSCILRLNTHTGVCERSAHHLGRVLNYRRVGDYEIFFLFLNHIVVLKDRVLRHVLEYQLLPDYHSRLAFLPRLLQFWQICAGEKKQSVLRRA